MNRSPRQRDHTRHGYSLIELMVVMSMSAVATGGSVVCISTMLKGERITAAAVHESQVVSRLQLSWREDAHAAREWTFDSVEQKGEAQCDLALQDGRKVRYRSSDRGLVRQVEREGSPDEQDVFQFPQGTHFQFQQVEQPRLARLKVIRPALDSRNITGSSFDASQNVLGNVAMTFDAALGREARLLESLQTQTEVK